MNLATTKKFSVRISETDYLGHMKLSAIFQLMQETAEENAKLINLTYDKASDNNEIWVLSRIHAKFSQIPRSEDIIKIKTWPLGPKGVFAVREYLITTEKEDLIGKITSSWLIIDAKKRNIKRMRDFPKSELGPVFDDIAKKIRLPEHEKLVSTRTVQMSELDINKHVNNAVYYNWITDSLSLEQYNKYMISEISLNYSAETKFGEIIDIYHSQGENYLYVIAKNQATNETALVAKLKMKERSVF